MKWLVVVVGMLCGSTSFALMRVESCYEYNFSDKESVFEAKQICLNMAMRKAVETNIVFVQSSSLIQDYKLKEDLISSNTAGFLKNMKIVKEEVVGNKVTTCIEAHLDTVQIEQKVRQTVQRRVGGQQPIKSNGYIDILSTFERDGNLYVTYKIVTPTEYDFRVHRWLPQREYYMIFWNIYDPSGKIIHGGREDLQVEKLFRGEVRLQKIELGLFKEATYEWWISKP